MISRKLLILTIFLSVVGFQASGYSAEEAASSRPEIQADAGAQLMTTADFLARAGQFSVTIRADFDVLQETGEKIEFGETRNVTLARPDRMRVDVAQSDGEKSLVLFDGKQITVSSPDDKMYSTISRPGDVDQAIRFFIGDLHLKLPLALMFVTDLPSELQSRVRSVDFVEKDVTTDVPCTHLVARTDDLDFQIWIPSSGDPLPRRVVITYKNEPGQPQFRASFSEWNLSPNPPQDFFAYAPAQDFQRIPFLAMLGEAAPGMTREAEKGDKK